MTIHSDPHTDPKAVPGPGRERQLDPRTELSEFLRSRRARLKPADVGIPDYGRRRRVPGLRREELAQLAGVSVAYYTRLEQGNGHNVSAEVLDAISAALRLSDAEHAHLLHLAKPAPRKRRPAPQRQQVRPALQELLSAIDGVPAYVWGRRTDVLAWNGAASALFGDWAARAPRDRNWARIVFLDPEAQRLFADWESKASDVVGQLRLDAGRYSNDPLLAELVGELSVKSDDFRSMWATHNVKRKTHDTMRITHPLVGELTVRYETFTLPGDQEQALETYHAEPGSASEEALRLLASWGTDAAQPRAAASPD
ncbi:MULTISPECIES: helix-turn-helix domain-containing protein [unclassified Amycolatopsis]|uniref:helix-turn-helix domain-containing protein n=1 Tax=unclassified Amycolatopsis TaxID=2618356 RepID=UPI001C69814D|nr:helix-turn-helix transcriptional regulator [Amycolatopsis sp. DSM 110486]QYN20247.1 helix-turn-helix transcriptional regulator [Amycolatopsis sp. DSM 110486]